MSADDYHEFAVEDEATLYDVNAVCRICGEHRGWYLHI